MASHFDRYVQDPRRSTNTPSPFSALRLCVYGIPYCIVERRKVAIVSQGLRYSTRAHSSLCCIGARYTCSAGRVKKDYEGNPHCVFVKQSETLAVSLKEVRQRGVCPIVVPASASDAESAFVSRWRELTLVCRKMVKDLLHPSSAEEKRKHKLKRLVQSPNSFFMDVKCPGCEC